MGGVLRKGRKKGELLGGDKLLPISLDVLQRFRGVSGGYYEIALLRTLQGGRDIPNHHRLWMFYISKSAIHLLSLSLAESASHSVGMRCA